MSGDFSGEVDIDADAKLSSAEIPEGFSEVIGSEPKSAALSSLEFCSKRTWGEKLKGVPAELVIGLRPCESSCGVNEISEFVVSRSGSCKTDFSSLLKTGFGSCIFVLWNVVEAAVVLRMRREDEEG